MHGISKGIWAVAFLAVIAPGATAADPPSATLTAHGSAPLVCTIGPWVKISGPASLSGGHNAILTYGDSDLVNGESQSIVNGNSAVEIRAALLCNTGLTWGFSSLNGAFRLTPDVAPPAGFSHQWLYQLNFGPYDSGGGSVGGFSLSYTSQGTPFNSVDLAYTPNLSLEIAYFGLTFTPLANPNRMLAGNYSETFTLTMEPIL